MIFLLILMLISALLARSFGIRNFTGRAAAPFLSPYIITFIFIHKVPLPELDLYENKWLRGVGSVPAEYSV